MTVASPKHLDWTQKQAVQYAVPMWLRDEQVKVNIATVPGRIQPARERRTEPVAVVGYGPSLRETWEEIRGFPRIITCSGSHRFLIDRGIVPTWHVEVDPRDHKIALLGQPHPDVEYLIASTCHPSYLAHLHGYNVKLWHVFDATEDGIRLLPPGEWAVTGGCDVGLRAMAIAPFLGFRDVHVFGLDGCAREGSRHAADHPHGKQKYAEVEYEGKTYLTTPAMLEAARQTLHELKQLPGVRVTFHGEGLTQAMTRGYTPAPELDKPMAHVVGFSKPELISADYRKLNAQLHRENLAYGVGGGKHADTVKKLVATLKPPVSVLDYGCGKGYLAKALPFAIWEYDPAVPGKEEPPRPADLVVCTDVLEHVEPEKIAHVLWHLATVTRQVGYFVIHTGPSMKTLADGRNSHLLQRDREWWSRELRRYFKVGKLIQHGPLLYAIVAPKGTKAAQIRKQSSVVST